MDKYYGLPDKAIQFRLDKSDFFRPITCYRQASKLTYKEWIKKQEI